MRGMRVSGSRAWAASSMTSSDQCSASTPRFRRIAAPPHVVTTTLIPNTSALPRHSSQTPNPTPDTRNHCTRRSAE
eukprot:4920-Rhodomonas_salina.1